VVTAAVLVIVVDDNDKLPRVAVVVKDVLNVQS